MIELLVAALLVLILSPVAAHVWRATITKILGRLARHRLVRELRA
jgi:hypothetical protein